MGSLCPWSSACPAIFVLFQRRFDGQAAQRVSEARKAKRLKRQQQQQQDEEDEEDDYSDLRWDSGVQDVNPSTLRKRRQAIAHAVGSRIPGLADADKCIFLLLSGGNNGGVYVEAGGVTKAQLIVVVRGLLSEMMPKDKRLLALADGDFSGVVQYGRCRVAECRAAKFASSRSSAAIMLRPAVVNAGTNDALEHCQLQQCAAGVRAKLRNRGT
jgi:hypothetical protein